MTSCGSQAGEIGHSTRFGRHGECAGHSGMIAGVGQGGVDQYGIGAQILLELGVRSMILLTNTKRTIVGLDGYGLELVRQEPIPH